MNFRDSLKNKDFVITAEIFPPKGPELSEFKQKAEILKNLVDAINVTDNQRAVMRISSLAASKVLLDLGVDPIFQITCRDRNRLALQSDLIGAYALGIKNVLALSGDHPLNGDHPESKPVYDLDTVQLIKTISTLNKGFDLAGNKLNASTNFTVGAVCNVVYDNIELQYLMVEKKIQAGALFFQTQAVFDSNVFKSFIKKIKYKNVRFLAGILPLKSAQMAKMLNEKVPGIVIPEEIIKDLEKFDNQQERGIQIASSLIRELKKFADGVHIMAINFEHRIPDILKLAGILK
jgi:5,10-methylenetetrahydrofolate reductase